MSFELQLCPSLHVLRERASTGPFKELHMSLWELGGHFALMSNSHPLNRKGKRSWLTTAQIGEQREVLQQVWLDSQNFSALGMGYLRQSRPKLGPHADNAGHLEGPRAERRKLEVTLRDGDRGHK